RESRREGVLPGWSESSVYPVPFHLQGTPGKMFPDTLRIRLCIRKGGRRNHGPKRSVDEIHTNDGGASVARRGVVTGGAGFVGSHLVDELLARGDTVRILDNLDPQVHEPARRKPGWVPADAEFVQADVRDLDAVRRALEG